MLGVSLVSLSLMGFEIVLTRLLSVMLTHHYVFAITSLALFGMGIGSVFVYLCGQRLDMEKNSFNSLALYAGLLALSMVLSALLVIEIGYLSAIRDNILVYGLILVVPFFFGGAFLACVFRLYASISARVYCADLVGAAVGSMGVIIALNYLGIRDTILFLSLVTSMAAMMFTPWGNKNLKPKLIPAAGFLTVAVFMGLGMASSLLPDLAVGVNRDKEIYDAINGFSGRVIETKESAFGRIDLVKYEDYPQWMDLYVDGTAGMPMYSFSGNYTAPGAAIQDLKASFPGYFPFLFLKEDEKDNALVIGPGGGRDILLAKLGGVNRVTAVEVNKNLVDMVRKYSWYNGGIYQGDKDVNIIVAEGRNYLQRDKTRYDLIMFSLPVTNTSRSPEGYALTENFLYTTEAIEDYLAHLTEEGRMVAVTHNDLEVLRLLSITLDAFAKMGVSNKEAMKHINIIGSADYPVFVLKKTGFQPDETMTAYNAAIHQFGYSPLASYFPHIMQPGMVNPALMSVESGQWLFSDVVKMVKEQGYDISPVSDNSPFFYKFDNGLPEPVLNVLYASLILMFLIILIPLFGRIYGDRRQRGKLKTRNSHTGINIYFVSIFLLLGTGFMLVEITLIQRFSMFLGQPVLSLAAVLFSILVGAGLGSLWSGRLDSGMLLKYVARAAFIVVALLITYSFLLPLVLGKFLALSLLVRVAVMVTLILPLGFIMGFPFPLVIRTLKEMNMETTVPWMLAINGISSVFGSALTIVIAIQFGFTEAMLMGALCYLAIFSICKK